MIDVASNVIPFGGSALCGYAMGFAIKKIVKYLVIVIGVFVGVVLICIAVLQKYAYTEGVHWDHLGNDMSMIIQTYATQFDITHLQSGILGTLGLSVSRGLGIGLLAGFVRTR